MAVEKRATAVWTGSLLEGSGTVSGASGAFGEIAVSWPSRAEQGAESTSPEELIAAAHAACFSMALSHGLAQDGTPPQELRVTATVGFQPGAGHHGHPPRRAAARCPGLDQAAFADGSGGGCGRLPVSKALASVEITHTATLA